MGVGIVTIRKKKYAKNMLTYVAFPWRMTSRRTRCSLSGKLSSFNVPKFLFWFSLIKSRGLSRIAHLTKTARRKNRRTAIFQSWCNAKKPKVGINTIKDNRHMVNSQCPKILMIKAFWSHEFFSLFFARNKFFRHFKLNLDDNFQS